VKSSEVNVRGFKYRKHVRFGAVVDLHYGYILHNELVYEHNYKNIIAIFQKRDGRKHGYYCVVRTLHVRRPCITDIKRYDNGKCVSYTSNIGFADGYYRDEGSYIVYPENYLFHWLHDAPSIPRQ
jgi:hypothetical protein